MRRRRRIVNRVYVPIETQVSHSSMAFWAYMLPRNSATISDGAGVAVIACDFLFHNKVTS